MLLLLSVLIFVVALFFIQEGEAHRAKPGIVFFVDFPAQLLIPSYVAAVLMIPNFAILLFTWWRRLYKRRWPYVFALIGTFCLGIVVWHIGFGGVLSIIDPSTT